MRASLAIATVGAALMGCTSFKPPEITYDDERPALLEREPAKSNRFQSVR
jgi:hypothetical protein